MKKSQKNKPYVMICKNRKEQLKMKIDKLKTEFEKAKQKATEWQIRVKDLERQITEQENLEIIQAVRCITSSPEELRQILKQLQVIKTPQINLIKKEGKNDDEN